MNYLSITIGPIIKTLSMARKPRELWSASYLFSQLMGDLITEISKEAKIISPGIVSNNYTVKVGLYPDRLFCKEYPGGFESIAEIINTVKVTYANKVGVFADYFKIYALEIEAENDGQAVDILNKRLDYMELYNPIISDEAEESVRKLIVDKKNKLDSRDVEVDTLAELASVQLKHIDPKAYETCGVKAKKEEEKTGKDAFIRTLKTEFKDKFKTPHKYICIVHADGDNIGTIINTLNEGELTELSNRLLEFGQKACGKIKAFGGLPIYAGGDDLLFIAPVVFGKEEEEKTIFDLIDRINNVFQESKVPEIIGEDPETKKKLIPSMSYGISITYYKYPLYEALNMSRELLFDVAKELRENRKEKGTKIKQAIAWTLQKGSGSSVSAAFSTSAVEEKLSSAFDKLLTNISSKTDPNLITAVIHKIKSNEELLKIIMEDEKCLIRINAFFETTLEYNSKKESEQKYLNAVKELLLTSYLITNDIKETVRIVYAMLRTAKFIKGLEDDKDE